MDNLNDERSKPEESIKVIQSCRPNSREKLWFTYLENLPFASDNNLAFFADKLMEINTALIAAYVAALVFIKHSAIWYLLIPAYLFFLSLIASIYSILPRRVRNEYIDFLEFKNYYFRKLAFRWYLIVFALLFFLVGLITEVLILLYC